MLGRYEEGRAAVDRAAALAPDWLPTKVGNAQMFFAEGKPAEAAAVFPMTEELIGLLVPHLISDPLYRDLWETVVPEPYQETLAKLRLRDAPTDSAEYYRAKGRLYARRGNAPLERVYFDSARGVLEGRRARGTSSVFLNVDLAMAYAVLGRTADARAQADTEAHAGLLRRDAFRGWFATLELAHLYARLGLKEECIAILRALRGAGGTRPMPANGHSRTPGVRSPSRRGDRRWRRGGAVR
jgi:hypothetical protein